MNKYHYNFSNPSGKMKIKPITLSTKLILQEAEKLGIKWKAIEGTEIIKLSFKSKNEYFHHQVSPLNSNLAIYCCKQKNVTKSLLKKADINVAPGFLINKTDSNEYLKQVFKKLKKPLVIKPQEGSHGDSVTVNINNFSDFEKIIKKTLNQIKEPSLGVLAEEMFVGTEYRITATKNKIIGVANRVPANVIGNGESTIRQLIEIKNSDPKREDNFYNTGLKKIPINEETIWALTEQNLKLENIPKKDELIFVRLNSNLSTGGDSIDFTDEIHPSVKKIAIKTINAIPGLEFAGLDFMCKDITKQQTKDSYIVVEINNSPGIFMHDLPFKGKNRHASREFLKLIFPELS